MNHYEKIAVFDFDDTLCDGNSHLMILKSYFKTGRYESIAAKLFGRVCPHMYQNFLDKKMKTVPLSFVLRYQFPLKKKAVMYMDQVRGHGYHCIIISYAPGQIIEAVARQLQIETYQSERGEKDRVLRAVASYDELFVCTDNKDDCCLLDRADKKVIFVNKRTKKFFAGKYPDAVLVEE